MEVAGQVEGQFGPAVGGSPVYLAQGRRIQVIAGNDSDGLDLVHASEMLGGRIESLVRINDLLIAGWRSLEGVGQLSWFSLADPNQPEWLRDFAYKSDGRPVDLAVVGNVLYVVDSVVNSGPLLFPVDITDPAAPVVFEPLELAPNDSPTLTVFNDQFLLASGTNIGLHVEVIDISLPQSPEQVGYYEGWPFGGDTGVIANADYMVLLGLMKTEVVSLSDPSEPELLSVIPAMSGSGFLFEDHLYLPIDNSVRIWDLNDPSAPIELAPLDVGLDVSHLRSRAAIGPGSDRGIFFYRDGEGVGIDLSDPSMPALAGHVAVPRARHVDQIQASPSGAVAIDRGGMLRLYDIELNSLPLDPSVLAPQPYSSLAMRPDGLGVLLGDELLHVVDLEDSAQPQVLGQLSTGGLPVLRHMTIAGDRAWAFSGSTIVEFDLADPSSPAIAHSAEVDGLDSTSSAVFSKGHLYLVSRAQGVFIVKVDTGSVPQLVGTYTDCSRFGALDILEDLAVLACNRGLLGRELNWDVLDVSEPDNPVLLAEFAREGAQVVLQDHQAWLSGIGRVDLVDLGDPQSPFLVARYNVPGRTFDLSAGPSGVWVAAEIGGVARLEAPARLTPGQTASWFDPDRSGEGWTIEILEDDRALSYWYSYDESGNQRWMIGNGEVRANRIVFEMDAVRGGRFGPNFDPDEVELTPAGKVRMMWTGCDRGWFQYLPDGDEVLALGFERLTRTLGLEDCGGLDGSVDNAPANQSGSWYDPAQSGQGFNLLWLDTGMALVKWFTFDPHGNPYWMLGVGQAEGNAIVFPDIIASRGASFGMDFDPADVELFHWGELQMALDCLTGTADYISVLPEFGSGSFELERLTVPAGLGCD